MSPTILIADDDRNIIDLLRQTLEPLGFRICETYDAISALSFIQRQPPALVILDVTMPAGNGLSACEMLASDKWLSRVPVIILTARQDEATMERCRQLNAYYVQKGPEAMTNLVRIVQRRLSGNNPVSFSHRDVALMEVQWAPEILIADDDRELLTLLRNCLEGLGLHVTEAPDSLTALMQAHRQPPDLLILDVNMPGGSGLNACEMIYSDPSLAHLPMIVLTGRNDEPTMHRCQRIGAHYVRKGTDSLEQIVFLVRHLLWAGDESPAADAALWIG